MASGLATQGQRARLVGLVILAALAWCTLVPGTPVNNDPSPAAATAGIHLTTPVAHHVGVVAVLAAALALLVLRRTTFPVATVPAVPVRRQPVADPVHRVLLRVGRAARRGPPAGHARA